MSSFVFCLLAVAGLLIVAMLLKLSELLIQMSLCISNLSSQCSGATVVAIFGA